MENLFNCPESIQGIMALKKIFHLIFNLLAMFNSIWFIERPNPNSSSTFNRSSFPKNFTFGTGSSSYQYEGAYNEDGRGRSIWDIFTHKHPEKIAGGGNGDLAVDHYHLYREDVALVKEVGMDAYRFSISWSRILAQGKLSGGVNMKGIQFYNNLIDELLSKGLQPYATIFHWDVPQPLEDEYGGFLNSRIINDFQDYAELCFKEFGDRVKFWFTMNEPFTFSNAGYNLGIAAPGRCSKYVGNCTEGNSGTEPYITGHNQLLAHAAAVKVYRKKYQGHQKGKIGMSNLITWMVPFSETEVDRDAAQRTLDFSFGWFMNPITYGTYPKIMRALLGDRLPRFTKEQSKMLKGSCDFIGMNYYTANYAANNPFRNGSQPSYNTDFHATLTTDRNGILIGPKAGSSWLCVYPRGIFDILLYTKQKYRNPTIYITENGVDELNNNSLSLEETLADETRIDYHSRHLKYLLRAIKEGVDLRGYFVWSLLDSFEWVDGYTVRFGMNYVDYKTMKRYPKHSSVWFKKFLLHA